MPKGGGEDSDGLGDAHPAMWESRLSRADERRIRQECFIPPFVKVRFAERGAGAIVRSDRHEVCVYETMFRAGFRLPFLPMVRDLLAYLDLSPHQIAPNAWRFLYGCMVLWPLALGKEHQLTAREFLHLHRVHRNPGGSGVYNIQTRRGRLVVLEPRYSSNHGWKTKFFFASGQWEFAPTERATDVRVPREVNMLSDRGGRDPRLTPKEVARVEEVLKWARRHESSLTFEVLGSVPRLMELVYAPAGHVSVELTRELVRVPIDPSPPAANTRGATPRKGKASAVGDRPTKIDKGKGKVVEPEKPKKATYPIQTGGDFKIREPRRPSPPVLPIASPVKTGPLNERRKTEAHPKVARALKLADEESDTEKPVEAATSPTLRPETPAATQGAKEAHEGAPVETTPARIEDSEVEVIKVPFVKKRKLKRTLEPAPLVVEPVVPAVENFVASLSRVADFLVARRCQAPPPSVPRVEEVAAFLANEPIPAVPVNAAGLIDEPLMVPEGPIPSMLDRQLGSNIQHILEDLEVVSEGSVGMADENLGPFMETNGHVSRGPLSPIPEVGTSSRGPTLKRSRDEGHVEEGSGSRRPRASEASETSEASESTVEIQPEGADWAFRGKLAKFGGELKGNPVKAVFDLVDHQNLRLKNRDLSARGMAEEMLSLHFLVSQSLMYFTSRLF
jgi:hypothetical protein